MHTMRRYVQILGLVLLALAAGGWGSIVAAAFCPHMNGKAEGAGTAQSLAADDASCHTKLEVEPRPSCHDSATEQQPSAAADTDSAHAMPADGVREQEVLGLPGVACTHCMSRPESPVSTAISRQQAAPKRSLELPLSQAPLLRAPQVSFILPVLYRQGAPPGFNLPKHLLIGVLLI